MQNSQDFLFELGCEEIPARYQESMVHQLQELLHAKLQAAGLSYKSSRVFATPRRLALCIHELATQQPAQLIKRTGPPVQRAYSSDGTPTAAAVGFAKLCGIDVQELRQIENEKGHWLYYEQTQLGKATAELLPAFLQEAIAQLSLPKAMRWGEQSEVFIRPVHWVLALFGTEIIPITLFGLKSANITHGHRFHHPQAIALETPRDYQSTLYNTGFVIADFSERKKYIQENLHKTARPMGDIVVDDDLLNEVTGLVEWPQILLCQFDARFLQVPAEVLITSMRQHQKCFSLVNAQKQLQSFFLVVSNIQSHDPLQIIAGNEKVMRARLNDAEFFYQKDKNILLASQLVRLDAMIFQAQLGSLGQKAQRLSDLSGIIAHTLNLNADLARQAGLLAKCDLASEMVNEFPELQGIMGYYYAIHQNENKLVAASIKEQYLPRFSKDTLPEHALGCVVALADRIDLLIGLLGIGRLPSGDKDPFGLRRAAIGLIRLILEKQLDLDLHVILLEAEKLYATSLTNTNTQHDALNFIYDRLQHWYAEQQAVPVDWFHAVVANRPTRLLDFDKRIQALRQFINLPEAATLVAAHKRVKNILKTRSNTTQADKSATIDVALFEGAAEIDLFAAIQQQQLIADTHAADYVFVLTNLAQLKKPIDAFFDQVMVLTDDLKLRENRLSLLSALMQLFGRIVDLSQLQLG